jgi:hypothetical protein
MITYLCKERVEEQIEAPTEDFISNQDSEVEIGHCDGTGISMSVWEILAGGDDETGKIEAHDKYEEFTVKDVLLQSASRRIWKKLSYRYVLK